MIDDIPEGIRTPHGEEKIGTGGGGDHQIGELVRARVRTRRWERSTVTLLEIKRRYPLLYSAIHQLPWKLARPYTNGLVLNSQVWRKVEKEGPEIIPKWIDDNRLSFSAEAMTVVSALVFFHAFFTWDSLLDYLKDYSWGELKTDPGTLDSYPKKNEAEEKERIRIDAESTFRVLAAKRVGRFPEQIILQKIKPTHCKRCGTDLSQGFWKEPNDLRTLCKKCGLITSCSNSEVDPT
jgi:hypothetical protein